VEQTTLYPTEPHVPPTVPAEEWHLTEEEQKAVKRFGTHNQTGIMPSVIHKNLEWQDPPGTPFSPGEPGQKSIDGSYLYICVRKNYWKRVPTEDTF